MGFNGMFNGWRKKHLPQPEDSQFTKDFKRKELGGSILTGAAVTAAAFTGSATGVEMWEEGHPHAQVEHMDAAQQAGMQEPGPDGATVTANPDHPEKATITVPHEQAPQ